MSIRIKVFPIMAPLRGARPIRIATVIIIWTFENLPVKCMANDGAERY